jgi:hypothetical protein
MSLKALSRLLIDAVVRRKSRGMANEAVGQPQVNSTSLVMVDLRIPGFGDTGSHISPCSASIPGIMRLLLLLR